MSQVIVTHDNFSDKRAASLVQEHQIDRESAFSQWRRNDITGKDPVAAAVGIAVLPVALFWSFVATCISVSFSVMLGLFKVLSKIFR